MHSEGSALDPLIQMLRYAANDTGAAGIACWTAAAAHNGGAQMLQVRGYSRFARWTQRWCAKLERHCLAACISHQYDP
jgi:hypothetical protein